MNTIDTMRMFSDGQMSIHDTRALMVSMGHNEADIANAFVDLSSNGSIRVGRYNKEEYQAELYLTVYAP